MCSLNDSLQDVRKKLIRCSSDMETGQVCFSLFHVTVMVLVSFVHANQAAVC
jgi:hypothetical protein